jgi:hypothetical protein
MGKYILVFLAVTMIGFVVVNQTMVVALKAILQTLTNKK